MLASETREKMSCYLLLALLLKEVFEMKKLIQVKCCNFLNLINPDKMIFFKRTILF